MNAQALAAIEQRLARLEASANGRSIGNGEDSRLSRPETARYLGCSPSTIMRWQEIDPHFPKPEVYHGRYYWRLSTLRAYDENRSNM